MLIFLSSIPSKALSSQSNYNCLLIQQTIILLLIISLSSKTFVKAVTFHLLLGNPNKRGNQFCQVEEVQDQSSPVLNLLRL